MIAVAVRSVDHRQVLAARRDPIHQSAFLFDRDESVDQDGVPLAVNEGRRYRRPHLLFRARRQVARDSGDSGRHEHLPVQRLGCVNFVVHLFQVHAVSPSVIYSLVFVNMLVADFAICEAVRATAVPVAIRYLQSLKL